MRSGPLLPRVPVADGDSVPAGIQRIEAVTPDGVSATEGIPAEQQVVVGVVDTGIDASHPDINYVGGQSWAANDANADRDGFGEGLRLLCLLPVQFLLEQDKDLLKAASRKGTLPIHLEVQEALCCWCCVPCSVCACKFANHTNHNWQFLHGSCSICCPFH
jgi:hypothetical protein